MKLFLIIIFYLTIQCFQTQEIPEKENIPLVENNIEQGNLTNEELSQEELENLLKKLKEEFSGLIGEEKEKQQIYEDVTIVNSEDLTLQENFLIFFFQDKFKQNQIINCFIRNQIGKNESLQFLETLKNNLPSELSYGLIWDNLNSRIFKKYNIKEQQKLILFNKMRKIIYDGDLNSINEINTWVNKNIYNSLINIETKEDYENFISQNNKTRLLAYYNESMFQEKQFLENLVNIGVFGDTGNYIVGYSQYFTLSILYLAENSELVKNLKEIVQPSIILFKDFKSTEQYVNYTGDFSNSNVIIFYIVFIADDILEFCHLNSLSPVTYLTEDTSYRIFAGPVKTQMILFINESENNFEIIRKFEEAAIYNLEQGNFFLKTNNFLEELFYERMIYAIITSNPENQEMQEFFGIENLKNKYPAIFISTIHKNQLAKYLFDQEQQITKENIIEFSVQFRLQNLTRNYLSEQIPEPTKKTLKKLVGQNFEQEVYRNHDNYLVLFCASIEEEQCTEHIQLFQKIAKMMNDNDKEIMGIGIINPIKNELPRFMNQPQLGEILLYLKGKKTVPEEYTGEIEFQKIKIFIQEKIPDITFKDQKKVLPLGEAEKIEL